MPRERRVSGKFCSAADRLLMADESRSPKQLERRPPERIAKLDSKAPEGNGERDQYSRQLQRRQRPTVDGNPYAKEQARKSAADESNDEFEGVGRAPRMLVPRTVHVIGLLVLANGQGPILH